MRTAVVNKETRLALQGVRDIDKRTGGQLVEKAAVARAKGDTVESMGEALAVALRVAYAPRVAMAPPPTVDLLNAFMEKVDWAYVVDTLLIRPELN